MASPFTRARASVRAARQAWSDPQGAQNWAASDRSAFYDLQWSYFTNEIWERVSDFATDIQVFKRYGNIKSLYNPTWRIGRFYMAEVWPGVLRTPGLNLPDGIPDAIPLDDGIDDALRAAIAQVWQWSNWQVQKDVVVLYDAVLGNCLVEVLDERDRGKVTMMVWWPGHVKDLQVDRGDVKMYHLEYRVYEKDADGKTTGSYLWGKRVDKDYIRYFKDSEPFNYGEGAEFPNPYGFVPACWFKFYDFGELFGQPALFGTLNKVDRLNDLASVLHDQIKKIAKSPIAISGPGGGNSTARQIESATTRDAARRQADPTLDDGDDLMVITLPQGGDVKAVPLNEANVLEAMNHLQAEIESDHPEQVVHEQLRKRNISGIAARQMMGDVTGIFVQVAAQHDLQMVKLHQMVIAIAGENIRSGVWANPNPQQSLFAKYNLDSYAQGTLNHSIVPRTLFEESTLEHWTAENMKVSTLVAKLDLKIPPRQLQDETGDYTKEQLDEFEKWNDSNASALGAALLAMNAGGNMTPNGQDGTQAPGHDTTGPNTTDTGLQATTRSGGAPALPSVNGKAAPGTDNPGVGGGA